MVPLQGTNSSHKNAYLPFGEIKFELVVAFFHADVHSVRLVCGLAVQTCRRWRENTVPMRHEFK